MADKLPGALVMIDVYETQLELRKLGKIDEKLFARPVCPGRSATVR